MVAQGLPSLHHVIEQVSQEKGIQPSILIEATEQAILTAAKRTFGSTRELEARFNDETGWVDLFQYMTVVPSVDSADREISIDDALRHGLTAEEGEELGFQIFYREEDAERARQQDKEFGLLLGFKQHRRGFGRIAAQTAKQVILQRVRDAERERVFHEYKERQGEIITGVVRRFERGSNIIVDLGRGVEAVLPPREQTPRESYRPGDRLVALLKKIDREARGPQLVLSRSDVGLLVKSFEMEVPEIYEGIVSIVAAAREPGARSKIAVSSRDSDVDPVGACVGMKGSRVQAVVQELRGEKIDIVPFDRDPARFVCNAIAPAEVTRVIIDETSARMELVVPDSKLSLAIGRRGQNVRLASQLTGWRLDIVSESRFRQIEEEAIMAMVRIPLVDEEKAKALYKFGFRSLDELAEITPQELDQIDGFTPDQASDLRLQAAEGMEEVRQERIAAVKRSTENPTEREKLMLVRGITDRVADALERGGYASVSRIEKEADPDRLGLKTGYNNQQARQIKSAVATFLTDEWPAIEEGILAAKAAAAEEARRLIAEREAAAPSVDETAEAEAAPEAAEAEAAPEAAEAEAAPEAAKAEAAEAEAAPEAAKAEPTEDPTQENSEA